jgi:superfamily II DNA or RNA helicase
MTHKQAYLLTGGLGQQLLPALRRAILNATEIEIAVSFIKSSGLELIFGDIEAALLSDRNVNLTLLTSDYLCVTEPRALRKLMLLAERGADIRIHQASHGSSFHLKAYIFVHSRQDNMVSADAFIGSSNISKVALTDGLEWNYHIDYPNQNDNFSETRIREIRQQYSTLASHPQVIHLDYPWIEQYELRYASAKKISPLQPSYAAATEPDLPLPTPRAHQTEALTLLDTARKRGLTKGLVVLATGLGKTFLAAFDVAQAQAKKVVFVAHRQEILLQAEASFLAVLPHLRIGRFTGKQKDKDFDLLFASVQTLGQQRHLEHFAADYFDYMVIDEFHHAAASSYNNILQHFTAKFMLGLTATPERTDQSDILALCDHNLIYRKDLFEGIKEQQLCPFHYYGIFDSEVDYEHIPWRNGRFDPEKLSNQLATLGRAKHIFNQWQANGLNRTLAFCASQSQADFMASYFTNAGIAAASVHTASNVSRSEAIDGLECGDLAVLFSVDLFNEGVDVPSIDTVLMLRPTESKILFLQQLGRGLRLNETKGHLIVLDFVGNHHSFLNRPELLLAPMFNAKPNRQQVIDALNKSNQLLPAGCFVNYDLKFVEFLQSLASNNLEKDYFALKLTLKRRPTVTELWNNGCNLTKLRKEYGSWWEFLDGIGEASHEETALIDDHAQWFRDLTITSTSKSYKLVLLNTLIEQRSLCAKVTVQELSQWSLDWYNQHPHWQSDLPKGHLPLAELTSTQWQTHWRKNPITYWCTAERSGEIWFHQQDMNFIFNGQVGHQQHDLFHDMSQEIVAWLLANYAAKTCISGSGTSITTLSEVQDTQQGGKAEGDETKGELISFFPNIKIACGHFKSGTSDSPEQLPLPKGFGRINADKHFVARASGNSMNGGKTPICDGDYLLLEQITAENAAKLSNQIIAIERQNDSGDNQYLLRKALKSADGGYTLRANNPIYDDILASDEMLTFARFKGIVDYLSLVVGQSFMREDIPPLFGALFNTGNWQSGHIVLKQENAQILLVTLNKRGKNQEHRYHDYFVNENRFHWQSQNNTKPDSSKGQNIIHHQSKQLPTYLFVREHKLLNGKAAPFAFIGEVNYVTHEGSAPMNVVWEIFPS